MIANQRFEKIIALINENGVANTKELANNLHVTEATIRRDLDELENQGKLVRVHGGAKNVINNTESFRENEKSMKDITENYMELSENNHLLIDASKLTQKGFNRLKVGNRFNAIICDDLESINKNTVTDNFVFTSN